MFKRYLQSFLLILFLFFTQLIFSQENENAHYNEGVAGLNKLFKKHLRLKEFGLEKDYQGTIVLRLQVSTKGTLDSMYVWFSPTKELGEAALGIIRMTRGDWIPEKKAGINRNAWVQYTYHFCPHYNCSFTDADYRSYKEKSRKAFLDGKRDKGLEYLRRAVHVEPSHGEDFYQLAKVLIEEGGDASVCRYLEIAMELTGNLYPEYFEYCGESRVRYVSRKQAEKEAFDAYLERDEQVIPNEPWQPAFPGDRPNVDDRYPGGADTLRKFLAMNLYYPEHAVEEFQGGLSVSSLTISPSGSIHEVLILHSQGPWIDKEVLRLLKKTRGRWKAIPDSIGNQSFVFQIYFALDPDCMPEGHISIQGDNILMEVMVCAIGIEGYKAATWIRKRSEDLIRNGKYKDGLAFLTMGNLRDPFNPYYYEQMSLCYGKMDFKTKELELLGKLDMIRRGDTLAVLDVRNAYGSRRIIKPTMDSAYSVREIQLDSSIIYSGKMSSLDPDIRVGKFYFFHQEGTIAITGKYQDDYPVDFWNYYNTRGEVVFFIDYNAIYDFLLNEEKHPFVDSAYLGRFDLGANDNGSFAEVENMPKFDGKDPLQSFRDYISEQLIYPEYARYHAIEGTVLVQFTIDQEGRIREPWVVKGISPDLNMEALRIIINSPLWTPGRLRRDPVAVVYTFPVDFYLIDRKKIFF